METDITVAPAVDFDHQPIVPAGTLRVDGDWSWTSPDGTTVVWYVGGPGPAFRVWTDDGARITRLRRLSRIEQYAHSVAGGPQAGFTVDRSKFETQALRRLLWGGTDAASDHQGADSITPQRAAAAPASTGAAA